MSGINGIPCRIKTPDAKGDFTNVETFYFASFKKCPALADITKNISKLQLDSRIKSKQLQLIERDFNEAQTEDEVTELALKIESVQESISEIESQIFDKFADFVRTGFKAAGYTDEDVERFFSFIDLKNFPQLVASARLGAGRVDFF